MRTFDVQGIEINAQRNAVFSFIRDPRNLPRWAQAFETADDKSARLRTPAGSVDIRLKTLANDAAGTVDWEMTFPDGASGIAQSRVTETSRKTCIYSFVLHAPPVPLEKLEGALDAQKQTLQTELKELKHLMEKK